MPLLSTVALLEGVPEKGLRRAQVGTVVEELSAGVYEVEFSDDMGHTYAALAIRGEQSVAPGARAGNRAA